MFDSRSENAIFLLPIRDDLRIMVLSGLEKNTRLKKELDLLEAIWYSIRGCAFWSEIKAH